ncbi:hypothetical protein T11_1925 [Trichinella zimbabwensis]|uniref:Uncharacterized protein n=1 Tax=Trichinella zimbabwensis TaxID=268475 RepID=A0A0V1GXI9_9BILA|nr:hypothetical protein T11_1925 [Trichinella zimbabwensis]
MSLLHSGYRSTFGPDDRWRSTVGKRRRSELLVMCSFGSRSMSSSKRVGARKVNSDGDGLDENNKAEADPPTVTALRYNPLN